MRKWAGLFLSFGVVMSGIAMNPRGPKVDSIAKVAEEAALYLTPHFKDISDPRFGMGRLVYGDKHLFTTDDVKPGPERDSKAEVILTFVPHSNEESTYVKKTVASRKDVSFYTVGFGAKSRMRGPAVIERSMRVGPGLPEISKELERIRKNPTIFRKAFQKGNWRFYAAPVAATSSSCLSCHSAGADAKTGAATQNLKIGDVLGALVVAVRE